MFIQKRYHKGAVNTAFFTPAITAGHALFKTYSFETSSNGKPGALRKHETSLPGQEIKFKNHPEKKRLRTEALAMTRKYTREITNITTKIPESRSKTGVVNRSKTGEVNMPKTRVVSRAETRVVNLPETRVVSRAETGEAAQKPGWESPVQFFNRKNVTKELYKRSRSIIYRPVRYVNRPHGEPGTGGVGTKHELLLQRLYGVMVHESRTGSVVINRPGTGMPDPGPIEESPTQFSNRESFTKELYKRSHSIISRHGRESGDANVGTMQKLSIHHLTSKRGHNMTILKEKSRLTPIPPITAQGTGKGTVTTGGIPGIKTGSLSPVTTGLFPPTATGAPLTKEKELTLPYTTGRIKTTGLRPPIPPVHSTHPVHPVHSFHPVHPVHPVH
ncbi:MAG: hypothetical protein GY757_32125, partial [bacterium]|nr:hypothetical protein [bacterium]